MTLKLLEAVIDAVSDYIKDNIAAKIAALNTEYEDSLLVAPKAYYLGNVPDELPEFPSIAFQGQDWTPEAQNSSSLEVSHHVNIYIYVGDATEETRFRILCRYARAIVELLNTGESTYGYTHAITGPVAPSDTLNASGFLQAIIIPVTFWSYEDY